MKIAKGIIEKLIRQQALYQHMEPQIPFLS